MRIRPRHRPFPRIRRHGHWFNQGPQVIDADSGVKVPLALTVQQRGGLVSALPADRRIDRVETMDLRSFPAAQPVFPTALWRVLLTAGGSYVTISQTEALAAVGTWEPAGYGYSSATAEPNLVFVYRLTNGSGDYALTASASERTTFLGSGYTDTNLGFYAFSTSALNRIPLYRAVNGSGIHRYTTISGEYLTLGTGWTGQGIIAYVLGGPERSILK